MLRCGGVRALGAANAGLSRVFDIEERLKQLSVKGDGLGRPNRIVDFEPLRADLERAVPRADRSKDGRPPLDHALMFTILVLQANHNPSDERIEYLSKDRLSFMRFLRLGLGDSVPDAKTNIRRVGSGETPLNLVA